MKPALNLPTYSQVKPIIKDVIKGVNAMNADAHTFKPSTKMMVFAAPSKTAVTPACPSSAACPKENAPSFRVAGFAPGRLPPYAMG